MDTAIQNGDFLRDAGGRLRSLDGREELLQRAYLRLQARRGAFPYDPQLGSRISLFSPEELTVETAMACIEEAMVDDTALTAVGTTVIPSGVAVEIDTVYGRGTVVIRPGKQGGEK